MEAAGRGIELAQNGISRDDVAVVVVFLLLLIDVCLFWFIHLIMLLFLGQKHSFTFDRVFAPDASQQEVFTEISQLVQSALDGYKVIFKFIFYSLYILSNYIICLDACHFSITSLGHRVKRIQI
jgi:hypothetical protein